MIEVIFKDEHIYQPIYDSRWSLYKKLFKTLSDIDKKIIDTIKDKKLDDISIIKVDNRSVFNMHDNNIYAFYDDINNKVPKEIEIKDEPIYTFNDKIRTDLDIIDVKRSNLEFTIDIIKELSKIYNIFDSTGLYEEEKREVLKTITKYIKYL